MGLCKRAAGWSIDELMHSPGSDAELSGVSVRAPMKSATPARAPRAGVRPARPFILRMRAVSALGSFGEIETDPRARAHRRAFHCKSL